MPCVGFYTEEVRDPDGARQGFDVVLLEGLRGPLARKGGSPPWIGSYGVDLQFLEKVAVPSVEGSEGRLIVIDEIGKMECLSPYFVSVVRRALDGPDPVLGTVGLKGDPFLREVRGRSDVRIVEVTRDNRDRLAEEVFECLKPPEGWAGTEGS